MADVTSALESQAIQQDLVGKVAVVTGASKGIGYAITRLLLQRGCSVLGTCSTEASLALLADLQSQTHREWRTRGQESSAPQVRGVIADLLSLDCAEVIADSLARDFRGRLNILILNAAITGSVRIGDSSSQRKAEEIQRFLTGNIQTPSLVVDELVRRRMFQEQSRIVLISSIRARQATATSSMYSATKAAGESLVRTWAEAFGGKEEEYCFMAGSTANAVQVGLTRTTAMARATPEQVEKYTKLYLPDQSLPRLAEPEYVADIVGFLVSHQSRWVTGSVVSGSGGGVKIG